MDDAKLAELVKRANAIVYTDTNVDRTGGYHALPVILSYLIVQEERKNLKTQLNG